MTADKPQEPEADSAPSGWAFGRIVEGLQGQPPLLVALGGGVLLIGLAGVIGGAAADLAWMLIGAVVLLVLAGLAAWVAVTMQGRRPAPRTRFRPTIRLGDVKEVRDMRAGSGTGPAPDDFAPNITAGDIEASSGTDIGSWDASGGERRRHSKRRRKR